MLSYLSLQLLVSEGPLVSLQPCKLLKLLHNLGFWFKDGHLIPVKCLPNDYLYNSQPQPSEKSHYEILSMAHAPLINVVLMTSDVALVSGISTENTLLTSQCIHLNISLSHIPWPLARATQAFVLFLAFSEALLKLPTAALAVCCIPGGSLPGCSI